MSTAYEHLLTQATEGLIAAARACADAVRDGADLDAPFAELDTAMSFFVEQTLSRVSSQAAGASVVLHRNLSARLDVHSTRLSALDAGQQLHEKRIQALERQGRPHENGAG